MSAYPSAGGDYSYSDDDWGPARDEDAPPLDEEPPMDWEPSEGAGGGVASPSSTGAGRQPAVGRGKPASGTAGSTAVSAPMDSGAPPAAPSTGQPAGAVHDPWTRAVEQAPGIWVVGDKSNVGSKHAPSSTAENIGEQAAVPHYAPATAQVPPSIPAVPVAAAADTAWQGGGAVTAPGNGHGEPDSGGYHAASPEHAPAPEFAMASAGAATVAPARVPPSSTAAAPVAATPVAHTPAASASVAAPRAQAPTAAPAAGRTETRQSLYQRLSNSPEAEAGRAKAPARAAAAQSTYVQDIPSADDETIEESGVFGRAAVERILGGKLIEERSLDGSPVPPRY